MVRSLVSKYVPDLCKQLLLVRGPGGRRGSGLFLQPQLVYVPYENKYGERYYEEADYRIDELTVIYSYRARFHGVRKCGVGPRRSAFLENHEQVGKIDVAEREPYGRHYHVVHE